MRFVVCLSALGDERGDEISFTFPDLRLDDWCGFLALGMEVEVIR